MSALFHVNCFLVENLICAVEAAKEIKHQVGDQHVITTCDFLPLIS